LKPDTFTKYVHDDLDKRRKLGRHAGRPSLLSEGNSQFLMQHTIQADRANNGLTPAQIIENMTTLQPELSQLQSRNHYHCTFIKKHADRLKQKPVKAQKLHQSEVNVLSPSNSDGSNYMKRLVSSYEPKTPKYVIKQESHCENSSITSFLVAMR